MTVSQIIFYLSGLIVIILSFMAVSSRRLLRAAIYLLFVLVAVAALYVMLDFLFLAAVQVVVYAGGILVLIIFSILLTSQLDEKLIRPNLAKRIISMVGAFGGIVITILVVNHYGFNDSYPQSGNYTVEAIGKSLLSYERNGYVLPFEVVSILLLAAMVAAIVVAKRKEVKDDK